MEKNAIASVWWKTRRPYQSDASLASRYRGWCHQQNRASWSCMFPWRCNEWTKHCTLRQKIFIVRSLHNLRFARLWTSRTLSAVRCIQRTSISCSPIGHATSGVVDTAKTHTMTCLLLLKYRPSQLGVVRCYSLKRMHTFSSARCSLDQKAWLL